MFCRVIFDLRDFLIIESWGEIWINEGEILKQGGKIKEETEKEEKFRFKQEKNGKTLKKTLKRQKRKKLKSKKMDLAVREKELKKRIFTYLNSMAWGWGM